MGLSKEGLIKAIEFYMLSDGGAYGMSSEGVMRKAAILSCGPYEVENLKIDTKAVYTNNTPSGAFRTFGGMQAQFATESMMDIAAEILDMDPFELRRLNMMTIGSKTHTMQTLETASLDRVLDAAEEASRWEKGSPKVRGSKRKDLNGPDTRKPCRLGARFKAVSNRVKVTGRAS